MSDLDAPRIVAGPLDVAAPDDPATRSWQYLPALDGLRALAVVAVVLFHYWPDTFPGGFVGVDVFFAMSGFLITGILHSEYRKKGAIDLRAFWGRRVRRLVPAVVVLVIVTAIATAATGTGSMRQLADSIGALTWTTNLVEAIFGGSRVWLHNSRTTLDHLWSLAIEEQFYLLWPLLAGLILRRVSGRRDRTVVVLVFAGLSVAAMGVVGGLAAYFRTDTRAFELLAGAALAFSGIAVVRRLPAAVSSALAVGGVAGLVAFVALVGPNDDWMFPWGFVLVSVCSVALVAAAADPPPWLGAALSWRPVRHLGQVSYGVYLWHIPVLRLLSSGRTHLDGVALSLVRFAVLAVVVEVSYRFVEEPFRRGHLPFRAPQFVLSYVAAGAALLLLVPAATRDLDGRWDAIDGPPRVRDGQRRVLVVGDLVGAAAADGLRRDDDLAVWSLADPGCPAVPALSIGTGLEFYDGPDPLDLDEFCLHWPARWTRGVARFRPDVVLIAGGYWDTLRIDGRVDDLTTLYEELLHNEVDAAAGTGSRRPEVALLRLSDWSELIDADQRPRRERLDAIEAYDAALDAVAADRGLDIVDVSGLDGWDGLRALRADDLP